MIEEYGFRDIKLKGGVVEPQQEIEEIRQLREAFGAGIPLRIDRTPPGRSKPPFGAVRDCARS